MTNRVTLSDPFGATNHKGISDRIGAKAPCVCLSPRGGGRSVRRKSRGARCMEQVVNVSNAQANQPSGGHARRLFYDRLGRYLFLASAALMTLIIFSIIFFVGKQGLLTLADVSPVEFFTSGTWNPTAKSFGALAFIVGSLETTLLSVVIGAPLGLLGAIFLAKLAPVPLARFMRPAVDLYVAIPSVVYGYIGLTLFIPFLRSTFGVPTGFGVLAASLVLAIMIMPTILSISTDALNAVPKPLEEASLALGATKLQTIFKVVLPSAMPGIITGITLTAGRALGETAILIFTAGTTVSRFMYDTDVMAGGETLAVHLWYLLSAGLVPDRDTIADGIGALLILTILVFNFLLVLPLKYFQRHSVGR